LPPIVRIESSPVYLDTSALVKLYIPEPRSDELEAAIVGRRDLFVSDLALTELCSALARRSREGDMAPQDTERVYRRAARDLSERSFRCAELTPRVHRDAERLLLSIGRDLPLRAADALHLALALVVDARTLVTFDAAFAAAAARLGSLDVCGA